MLIVNDEHRIAARIKSLSKRCPYCRKALRTYPLILSDDAGFAVFHASCASALAAESVATLAREQMVNRLKIGTQILS